MSLSEGMNKVIVILTLALTFLYLITHFTMYFLYIFLYYLDLFLDCYVLPSGTVVDAKLCWKLSVISWLHFGICRIFPRGRGQSSKFLWFSPPRVHLFTLLFLHSFITRGLSYKYTFYNLFQVKRNILSLVVSYFFSNRRCCINRNKWSLGLNC